jgi:hypothetical protein
MLFIDVCNKQQKQRLYISAMFLFSMLKKEITAKIFFENLLSHISGPTVSDANVTPTSELHTYVMLVLLIVGIYNV